MRFSTNHTLALALLTLGIAFTSCKKDKATTTIPSTSTAFVVNEGGFGKTNGSLSAIDLQKNSVANDVYATANGGAALGDVIQSALVAGNQIYMLANSSNEIVLADANSFTRVSVRKNANNPRYAAASNGKVFVSGWGTNKIDVYTQGTLTKVDSIDVHGLGPEEIVFANGKGYVANSGGYSNDKTVSIFDPVSNAYTSQVTVDDGPAALAASKDGAFLYILCHGDYGNFTDTNTATRPYLLVMKTADNSIVKRIQLGAKGDHFSRMAYDGTRNKLYILGNSVMQFETATNTLKAEPFVAKFFYGIGVEPTSGDVYVCDAKNFTNDGEVIQYSSAGVEKHRYTVGVAPNGVVFK